MTFEPKYNFASLDVGQAFEFETAGETGWRGQSRAVLRVRQAASQHKRRNPGWDYRIRQLGNGKAQLERMA
jgi:hypothetical protein